MIERDAKSNDFVVHLDCALQDLIYPKAFEFSPPMLKACYFRTSAKVFARVRFVLLRGFVRYELSMLDRVAESSEIAKPRKPRDALYLFLQLAFRKPVTRLAKGAVLDT